MSVAKSVCLLLGVFLLAGLQTARAEDEAKDKMASKDCQWCVITNPKTFAAGKAFEVKVELKGITEKTKLKIDIHYMKKDGSWGGCLVGTIPGKDVEKDGAVTFESKVSEIPEDCASIHALVFLSSDGSWDKKTKDAVGPEMTPEASK